MMTHRNNKERGEAMLSLRDLVDFAACSGEDGRAVLKSLGLTDEDLRRQTVLVSTRHPLRPARTPANPTPMWRQ